MDKTIVFSAKGLSMKALRNKGGFSLVEMILAITIFGMMSTVFLLLFSSSLMLSVRAGNREKAIVDATGRLDQYKSEPTSPGAAGVSTPGTVSVTITYLGSGSIDSGIVTATEYKYVAVIEGEKVTLKGFE